MAATYESIMSDLKAGKYANVYLLQGDEPYFIDQISGYIENNVLTPDERIFNQTIVYGKDTDVRNIDVMARRFPAMAKYQVVIVKEAQELKKIEDLVYYAQKPQKTTILVLCHKYKTLDKRKKLASQIEKCGVLFTSAKLYENKIPAWIDNYIKGLGLVSNPNSTRLLTEYLGTDLSKISNELDKLAIALPKGATVTPEIIQDNIGISKDYNNFELQNVIALAVRIFLQDADILAVPGQGQCNSRGGYGLQSLLPARLPGRGEDAQPAKGHQRHFAAPRIRPQEQRSGQCIHRRRRIVAGIGLQNNALKNLKEFFCIFICIWRICCLILCRKIMRVLAARQKLAID